MLHNITSAKSSAFRAELEYSPIVKTELDEIDSRNGEWLKSLKRQ